MHAPFRDGLVYGLNQIKGDTDASKVFCRFLFGSVRHIKVTVLQSMRKVHLADYDPSRLPDQIKYVEADKHRNKCVWVGFNEGWTLKFRLHSRETRIKPNVRSLIFSGFPWDVPEYNYFNLRIGTQHGNLKLVAYVENLFDKTFYVNAYQKAFAGGMFIEPSFQRVGLRATYSFGN